MTEPSRKAMDLYNKYLDGEFVILETLIKELDKAGMQKEIEKVFADIDSLQA